MIDRRNLLVGGTLGLGLSLIGGGAADHAALAADKKAGKKSSSDDKDFAARKSAYLRPLLYAREDFDLWLAGRDYPFCKYDPELGYLHIDRDFKEGQDGVICAYRYNRLDARRTIACTEKPCRINTYGNSFTSCEQVSDGETWQEVLAAHLGEPIRNYGIGGYSVYQAYLRMKREEKRAPARYVIVNIFDDDHFRNLLSWQRLRFGVNRKSPCPPIPYVKVDPDAGEFVERANPCPTPESLYRLCDLEGAMAVFDGDEVLDRKVRANAPQPKGTAILPPSTDFDDVEFARRCIYATTRVIEKIEEFAASENRKVLYVLSYGAERIKKAVKDGRRFDQALVEFLDKRNLPYVDLMQAHLAEFKTFATDLDAYLARYYIGHYNPLGNFFCAFAIKEKLVRMLNPAPPAYAPEVRNT